VDATLVSESPARSFADVVVGHLATVDSSFDAARFEVRRTSGPHAFRRVREV
jgi:hypothetical protein